MDKDGEVAQAESRVIEILQVAWRRYAQLALRAQSLDRRTRWGGIWIALLGLIFVALAYIFDIYSPTIPDISAIVIRGLFIVTPIIVAILAAYRGRSSGISDRQLLRGGAEEILSNIYLFRTVLKKSAQRRDWMGGRLVAVQGRLSQAFGKELTLEPYGGEIPPETLFGEGNHDQGFEDLSSEEFVNFRLENQIARYIQQSERYHAHRSRWILSILLAGGAGALVIAFGGSLTTWAGLIASLAFIQYGWKEQTKLDSQLLRANKVIAELIEIYENWKNQVDDGDDYKILVDVVQATEQVLWSFQSGYNQTAQRSMLDFKSEQFVAQEISEAIGAAVVYVPTIGVNFVDEPSSAVGSEGVSISDEYESELREGRGTGVRTFETYNGAITSFEKIEAEEDLPTDTLVGELQEGDEYEAIEVDEADVFNDGEIIENIETEESLNLVAIDDKAINEPDYTDFVLRVLEDITEEYHDIAINRETEMQTINQLLGRFQILDNDDQVDK